MDWVPILIPGSRSFSFPPNTHEVRNTNVQSAKHAHHHQTPKRVLQIAYANFTRRMRMGDAFSAAMQCWRAQNRISESNVVVAELRLVHWRWFFLLGFFLGCEFWGELAWRWRDRFEFWMWRRSHLWPSLWLEFCRTTTFECAMVAPLITRSLNSPTPSAHSLAICSWLLSLVILWSSTSKTSTANGTPVILLISTMPLSENACLRYEFPSWLRVLVLRLVFLCCFQLVCVPSRCFSSRNCGQEESMNRNKCSNTNYTEKNRDPIGYLQQTKILDLKPHIHLVFWITHILNECVYKPWRKDVLKTQIQIGDCIRLLLEFGMGGGRPWAFFCGVESALLLRVCIEPTWELLHPN